MTRIGVDLVTFAHPAFWGQPSLAAVLQRHERDPLTGWHTLLDALIACGISAAELTFAPGDLQSATAAFGSPTAAGRAMRERGIDPVSVYWKGPDWRAATRVEVIEGARRIAGDIARVGAGHLVLSLPMRAEPGEPSVLHVAEAELEHWAALLGAVADAVAMEGLRTAVHTESHSIMWTEDDIDRVMATTDAAVVDLCPDAGHIVLGGGEPVGVVRRHHDRVALAHWKDAVTGIDPTLIIDGAIWTRHREFMRPLGHGVVDWAGWRSALATTRAGSLTMLELDATPDPVGMLVDAVAFVRGLEGDV
jgi:inosose dehydratase